MTIKDSNKKKEDRRVDDRLMATGSREILTSRIPELQQRVSTVVESKAVQIDSRLRQGLVLKWQMEELVVDMEAAGLTS